MNLSRRTFFGDTAAFATLAAMAGGYAAPPPPRVDAAKSKPKAPLKQKPVPAILENADGSATDSAMVRRLYLDICGRLPTPDESRRYESSTDPAKKEHLIDALLSSESFADYWSMRYCDILRVKSEFPINLWPNAVYVYHRRIHSFVKNDEPWDRFAAALLGTEGSNFRVPEVNFLRATAKRTPEGLSEVASLTFLGSATDKYVDYFKRVSYKGTREWKEEIVWIEPGDGPSPRDFAKLLTGKLEKSFAAAPVRRVKHWLFGAGEAVKKGGWSAPDDAALVKTFRDSGYRLKPLLRSIFLSREYSRGSVKGGFPRRRMDAEVLDDVICDLTGATRSYQSIAPEPFTYLPPDRRSILIEDGSIANSFLLLFGRPPRDSGELAERDNRVTAKQRLYLFNSGSLYNRLGSIWAHSGAKDMKKVDWANLYYRLFLCRDVSQEERKVIRTAKLNPRDLAWCLINTREFLYRC